MPEDGTSNTPDSVLDRQIAEYLVAIEVEGKTQRTVKTYGETLKLFRRISREFDLPGDARQFRSRHVYAFLKAVADTGVDLISVGGLTHSVTALDISLDLEFA